jgi:hypothetical protein
MVYLLGLLDWWIRRQDFRQDYYAIIVRSINKEYDGLEHVMNGKHNKLWYVLLLSGQMECLARIIPLSMIQNRLESRTE